mgnify:CR=1 FL=1
MRFCRSNSLVAFNGTVVNTLSRDQQNELLGQEGASVVLDFESSKRKKQITITLKEIL